MTGLAAWIATIAFPTLLIFGWLRRDLGARAISLFVILALSAWAGLPRLLANGEGFVPSALALLDIALVLLVFKGDIKIT